VLRQSVITHSHLFQANKTTEIDTNMQFTASNISNASYGPRGFRYDHSSPSASGQQSFIAFRPGRSAESRISTAPPPSFHLSRSPGFHHSTNRKSTTSFGSLGMDRKRPGSPDPYKSVKSLKGDSYSDFQRATSANPRVDSIMDSIVKAKAEAKREAGWDDVDSSDECCSDEDCPEGRCYDVQCKDGRCSDDECSEQDCLDEDCSEVNQLGGNEVEEDLTHDESVSQATSWTYSCPTRDEHYRDEYSTAPGPEDTARWTEKTLRMGDVARDIAPESITFRLKVPEFSKSLP